jgi:hypothetical protein
MRTTAQSIDSMQKIHWRGACRHSFLLVVKMRAILLELRIMHYEWAMREIDPLHNDAPELLLYLNELKLERAMNMAGQT